MNEFVICGRKEEKKDRRKEGREGGRKKNWFLHNWYVLFPYSSYGNWNGNSLPSPYLLCRLFFAESDHQEGTNDSECCLLIPRTWSALILEGDDLLAPLSKEAPGGKLLPTPG